MTILATGDRVRLNVSGAEGTYYRPLVEGARGRVVVQGRTRSAVRVSFVASWHLLEAQGEARRGTDIASVQPVDVEALQRCIERGFSRVQEARRRGDDSLQAIDTVAAALVRLGSTLDADS